MARMQIMQEQSSAHTGDKEGRREQGEKDTTGRKNE
jgi:hypothetical protein